MSKPKFIATALLLIGLIGFCLYLNRDWFSTEPIQISHRVSPWMRGGRRPDPLNLGNPVVFTFNKFYRFKEIRVVLASELATNKHAHPLWHLASSSNSVFTSTFSYGDRVRGMQPAVKGATPDPLEPGIGYRLIVQTERGEAGHDFSTTARK